MLWRWSPYEGVYCVKLRKGSGKACKTRRNRSLEYTTKVQLNNSLKRQFIEVKPGVFCFRRFVTK